MSVDGTGFRWIIRYLRPDIALIRSLNSRFSGFPASFFARSVRIVDAGGGPMDARKAKRVFARCWYEGINIAELPPPARPPMDTIATTSSTSMPRISPSCQTARTTS